MSNTLVYSGSLTITTCWCGMRHAVPAELEREQQRKHDDGETPFSIYCPLGHTYVPAGIPEVERERERRRRAEARLTSTQDQLEASERSRVALRGHLTRAKRRIEAGVCPVPGCRRSGFTRVMSHVRAKHPDWLADHVHELDR